MKKIAFYLVIAIISFICLSPSTSAIMLEGGVKNNTPSSSKQSKDSNTKNNSNTNSKNTFQKQLTKDVQTSEDAFKNLYKIEKKNGTVTVKKSTDSSNDASSSSSSSGSSTTVPGTSSSTAAGSTTDAATPEPAPEISDEAAYSGSDNDGCVKTSIIGNGEVCDDGDGSSIYQILNLIVDIMTIGVGILGVIGISVAGVLYLTAGDKEEQAKKAKRRLFEIVIGLVVYVISYALLKWLLPGFNGIGGV